MEKNKQKTRYIIDGKTPLNLIEEIPSLYVSTSSPSRGGRDDGDEEAPGGGEASRGGEDLGGGETLGCSEDNGGDVDAALV